jgi:hypothetical protein
MNFEIIHTDKGDLSYCRVDKPIATPSDFLDVIMNCQTDTIALDKQALHDDFFELKTRLAGEFMQKVVNYGRRMVVLGDFENIESKSLNDLIYESNKTGRIVFAKTIEEAVELLK